MNKNPDEIYPLDHLPMPDDLSLLLDHWIIVRKDGTPILNGTPEQFESALRELSRKEREL